METVLSSEIRVLDKGFVRLDASMADDLSVVNSARVSFAKRSELVKVNPRFEHDPLREYELSEADRGLIRFLMKGRHGTPFEHNAFRFHVKLPIFVAREFMRHRIGSFNEMSGRYTKLQAEFYVPESQNVRTQVGKPGAYVFDVIEERKANLASVEILDSYEAAWHSYETLLDAGIAKELARLVLPVGIYTQFYWTVNARSLMNFISLRNAEPAMYEIREYARVIESIFADEMPSTHAAFCENGRVAP